MTYNGTKFSRSTSGTILLGRNFDRFSQTAVLPSWHEVWFPRRYSIIALYAQEKASLFFVEPRHVSNTSRDLERSALPTIIGLG